jgi:uncharacterized membrane protein
MAEAHEKKRPLKRIQSFLLTTVIGGFAVVLPIGLLISIVGFIYNFLARVLSPMRNLFGLLSSVEAWIVDLISIVIIVIAFFLIGLVVKTGIGRRVHSLVDRRILSRIPFYSTLRDTVNQFLGRKKMPFSQVVIAEVMSTKMTGFVTDEREDGTYTIFVPTAPNPTNGFIFHVAKKQLDFLDIRPEDAMRTIFGMGTGSALLFPGSTEKGKRRR